MHCKAKNWRSCKDLLKSSFEIKDGEMREILKNQEQLVLNDIKTKAIVEFKKYFSQDNEKLVIFKEFKSQLIDLNALLSHLHLSTALLEAIISPFKNKKLVVFKGDHLTRMTFTERSDGFCFESFKMLLCILQQELFCNDMFVIDRWEFIVDFIWKQQFDAADALAFEQFFNPPHRMLKERLECIKDSSYLIEIRKILLKRPPFPFLTRPDLSKMFIEEFASNNIGFISTAIKEAISCIPLQIEMAFKGFLLIEAIYEPFSASNPQEVFIFFNDLMYVCEVLLSFDVQLKTCLLNSLVSIFRAKAEAALNFLFAQNQPTKYIESCAKQLLSPSFSHYLNKYNSL